MLCDTLKIQKEYFAKNNNTSLKYRIQLLDNLRNMVKENEKKIVKAIQEDFTHRSESETYIAEIIPSLNGIKYIKKNLKKWMEISQRDVEIFMRPAQAKVIYQPLGNIGIIVPWNYPLFLALGPLSYALCAGNTAMIKMSEHTPHFSSLFQDLISSYFDPEIVAVINGNNFVAQEFSSLPFDHILFTGSTPVGKKVMESASKNLTPVTLELGGKSPTVIDKDYNLKEAVERICFGKSFNAGQTCISPDYVFVHENQIKDFIQKYRETFNTFFPDYENNKDYTAIINNSQKERLMNYLEDARKKGAEVHEMVENVNNSNEKMPPYLLTGVLDNMLVQQEEIFGPILPIISYKEVDEVKDFISNRERPLAIYLFSNDKKLQHYFENFSHSGGLCVNDTLMHVAVDDMPFGGIGHSGMGHYHGHEGFLTFSKAKGVFKKNITLTSKVLNPPYSPLLIKLLYKILT